MDDTLANKLKDKTVNKISESIKSGRDLFNKDLHKVTGKIPAEDTTKTVIKSVTDKIDKNQIKKLTPISDFTKTQKSLAKKHAMKNILGKEGLRSLEETGRRAAAKGDMSTVSKIVQILKKSTGKEAEKIASKSSINVAKKIGSKLLSKSLKMLPIIGPAIGVAQAFVTKDANAALPAGFEVESTGPVKGSPSSIIEDPKSTKEQRANAVKELMNRKGDMK